MAGIQHTTTTAIRLAGSREHASRLLLLLAAAAAFVLSVSLRFAGSESQGIFVGLWVPSILSLGSIMLLRGGERP